MKLAPPGRIHFIGVCGTAMAPLALFLKQAGFRVSGSDSGIYPPMSDLLMRGGIAVKKFSASAVSPKIKLAVVGNVARATNKEALAIEALRIPYISFPEFLEQAFLSGSKSQSGPKSIIAAGTHGKSSTAALAAFAAREAGLDPGFFIGASSPHFANPLFAPESPPSYFILEGDEYDCAFFLKSPKFLRCRPFAVILTGIEFDHADIYKDIKEVKAAFKALIEKIPPQGCLTVCAENPLAMEAAAFCKAPVISYGLEAGDFQAKNRRIESLPAPSGSNAPGASEIKRQLFEIHHKGRVFPAAINLLGWSGALNSAAVFALAHHLNWPLGKILEAMGKFLGVKRRLQKICEFQGALLFEDFAHHPTEVKASLSGLREAYPGRRLIALFEPRSFTSRTSAFQKKYVSALKEADIVFVSQPFRPESVPKKRRLSSERLAADLQAEGRRAACFEGPDDMARAAINLTRAGDLLAVMSNGGFGGIVSKLRDGLSAAKQPAPKRSAAGKNQQALDQPIDMILARHGQSLWNQKNLFTGWIDADLSARGVAEARQAGAFLRRVLEPRGLKLYWGFSSVLKRAMRTLDIILEEAGLSGLPVTRAWQLNERHYGALQGQSKSKVREKHGEEQLFKWRRGFDVRPPLLSQPDQPQNPSLYEGIGRFPLGESLKDTQARVLPFWEQSILPKIQKNRGPVLIAAHGNSLRALIKHIENIPDRKIALLDIKTGDPMFYSLEREKQVWSRIHYGPEASAAKA